MIPDGCAGRLSIGAVILIHLIVYNEEGGTTAVFSALVATGCALFSGKPPISFIYLCSIIYKIFIEAMKIEWKILISPIYCSYM